MLVENLTKYEPKLVYPRYDDDGYDVDMVKSVKGYVKFEEAVEAFSNSLQQLKAEISMQARSLELNFDDTGVVRHIAESLRQLSAV